MIDRPTLAGRAAPVICIGGCHVDLLGRPDAPFEPGTSCPGEVTRRPGGVARNVAALLGTAGVPVGLSSVLGSDATGRDLGESLAAQGVDLRHMLTADGRTGTYLAIHDHRGELVAAISDLGLYDRYRVPDALLAAAADETGLVFADANIPGEELLRLAEHFGERLLVDAISRAKAPKLAPLIGGKAMLVCNLPSAERLVGRPVRDPGDAAEALAAAGTRRALVSGGPLPLALLDAGRILRFTPEPAAVVDVTGTGDAQIAGLIAALAAGLPLAAAVPAGMQAARAALATAGALARLPEAVIATILAGTRA